MAVYNFLGILGKHGESIEFYANGKSVEVRVELDCPDDVDNNCCVCARQKTCRDCRNHKQSNMCHWHKDRKICSVAGPFDLDTGKCVKLIIVPKLYTLS